MTCCLEFSCKIFECKIFGKIIEPLNNKTSSTLFESLTSINLCSGSYKAFKLRIEIFYSFTSVSMAANDGKNREIAVKKEDSLRIRTIVFVISCILLVISIPILIVQTNKNQFERSKTEITRNDEQRYDHTTNENGSISEAADDEHRNRYRSHISGMSKERPCKCRAPFYPVENCAFCFFIPSFTENNFVMLEQYSKKAATKKCVDELKGEIPSSK